MTKFLSSRYIFIYKLLTVVVGLWVALGLWFADAVEHDLLPRLPGGRPEEHQQRLEEGLEVVVPVDGGPLLQRDLAEHLTQAQHQYLCCRLGLMQLGKSPDLICYHEYFMTKKL